MSVYNQDFYSNRQELNVTLKAQIAVLERLNELFKLDLLNPYDTPEKQKQKIDIVRHLIITALPHISPEDGKKYSTEILKYQLNTGVNIKGGSQSIGFKFDREIDKRLNEIIFNLQFKLRGIYTKFRDDEVDGL